MENIAILGGAFNPVHHGHVAIAEFALHQSGLNRVIWVPAFNPPHKSNCMADFEHRLEMVRQAIAGHSAFVVSDIDRNQEGVSYAVVTLRGLQSLYPDANWFWILGIDTFQTLVRWYDRATLTTQCHWLVAPRTITRDGVADERGKIGQGAEGNGEDERSHWLAVCDRVATQCGRSLHWQLLQMPQMEISSSLIRENCRQGRSIQHLVPKAVRKYIEAQHLYTE